mmetsp:Transcript_10328/g.10320  ORF Transcript_10328/g.10320 Transcript_10328/m.10320 type:complete len:95 (+) Transcript_10328:2029-2313(+)
MFSQKDLKRLQQNWKTLERFLRVKDLLKNGYVMQKDFKKVLRMVGINIRDEDMKQISEQDQQMSTWKGSENIINKFGLVNYKAFYEKYVRRNWN